MPTFNFMIRTVVVLVLLLMLAGCVSLRKAADSEYGDILVGDVYEFNDGVTMIYCEQLTLWIPWGGNVDCIVPRGTNRPKGGQIAKGELPGPVRVKVYKIKHINAIDYVDEIVYVRVLPKGGKYVAGSSVLSPQRRIYRLN